VGANSPPTWEVCNGTSAPCNPFLLPPDVADRHRVLAQRRRVPAAASMQAFQNQLAGSPHQVSRGTECPYDSS
jgi:hypothetical protein